MGSLTKWFVFTIVFALLPFGCSLLLQQFDQPGAATPENSPELLFFSIMVCAAGLGELSGFRQRAGWRKPVLGSAFGLLRVGAIVSSVVFGVYSDHARKSPGVELGIDCTALAALGASAKALVLRPGVAFLVVADRCARWRAVQTHIFQFSVRLAILLGIAGTAAVLVRASAEEE
jgi:hypothetical protein